jgi:phosphoglycerate dehydrogenase-like enzyme
MIKGLFLLDPKPYDMIYSPLVRLQIQQLVDIYAPPQTSQSVADDPSVLSQAEVILSGWGCPTFTEDLLQAASHLKAIFYGAGSIRYFVTEALWERGIIVSSAYKSNDIPVVEFTLAQILLGLKRYWHQVDHYKQTQQWWDHIPAPGGFGSVVGIISLGMIGSLLAERLKTFELKVIAYDPFATQARAEQLGVQLFSLEEIFQRADVVSLHTPWLPETEGLITGAHIASMKPGATFINTARGAVVREAEMISVLQARPDLCALLDVTYPEPPLPDSPLLKLPNVYITPHIAGPNENECKRNGQYVIAELKRYLNGEPLLFAITRQRAGIMA